MKTNITIGVLIAALILAVMSAIYFWYAERNKPPVSQIEYIKVPEVKTVTKIQRVEVPGPERIVTIEKPVIIEKLKLPEWVKDADKQIIATAEIQPHDGKTNTVAVLDIKTGVAEIIAKQEPPAFMAFTNQKEFGVRAGYATDRELRATVYGRWSFARVGKIHLGVYGEGNSQGDGIAQLEVSYRF